MINYLRGRKKGNSTIRVRWTLLTMGVIFLTFTIFSFLLLNTFQRVILDTEKEEMDELSQELVDRFSNHYYPLKEESVSTMLKEPEIELGAIPSPDHYVDRKKEVTPPVTLTKGGIIVKVYNDEDKDVMIPKISLKSGAGSLYKINVDGKSGFEFNNVALRKKDSLYIFVEIAPTASVPEAIAEDRILFANPTGEQHVTLFSVVQDAEFFVETPTNPNILSGNIAWNNDKAKIIYGNLTLSSGSTLNINQGTKVYFFKNSGMKVSAGAALNINGDLGKEVVIRGDRNDPKYDTLPKNWNAINFESGATLNMNYARLFGGTIGLKMKQTTATISNSIIHTFQESGIYAVNSSIIAKNLVMNNCGDADVTLLKGGNYQFTHCTLANYWEGTSTAVALSASNKYINDTGQTENGPLNLTLKNSILYNKAGNAVEFKPTPGQI